MADRPHPEQGFRTCLGVLALAKSYDATRLDAACRLDPIDPEERARPSLP
jgi:hypothetical protein